jgi:hypothetical protein
MLTKINSYFGNIGNIVTDNSSNVYRLKFIGISNCLKIKKHFDIYPLFTYKQIYYKL